MNSPYVRFASLYENRLVITQEPIDGKRYNFTPSEYHRNPTNAKYTGTLSARAQKTIDKRLHAWVYTLLSARANRKAKSSARKYIPIFVTLTLPAKQVHDDRVIKKKVLELFIKRLQYNCGVTHYFWRAEVQQNGNIHFHMVFDRFIDKHRLSQYWNDALEPLGYIDAFENKHGHRNPPAVNVRKLYSNSANIWYMLKYCGKDSKGRPIQGAVFRFSRGLIKLKGIRLLLEGRDVQTLRDWVRDKVASVFEDKFFAVIFFDRSYSLKSLHGRLGAAFQEVIAPLFQNLYLTGAPPPTVDELSAVQIRPAVQCSMFDAYGR
jgi:hypothetical protein